VEREIARAAKEQGLSSVMQLKGRRLDLLSDLNGVISDLNAPNTDGSASSAAASGGDPVVE